VHEPLPVASPDARPGAAKTTPATSRRVSARVVLRDGQTARGIRLDALFAGWPAGARDDALAQVRDTFGARTPGAVFVERQGQHVELVDLSNAARLRLLVPVGL
jgi:hypothetical protein